MSATTRERNVGAAADPEDGPAHTKFAFWFCSDKASVPDDVIGEPAIAKTADGADRETDVTVPEPPDADMTPPLIVIVVPSIFTAPSTVVDAVASVTTPLLLMVAPPLMAVETHADPEAIRI